MIMEKNVYCTLFDSNYLASGLALYESLVKECKDFHLYIFAFDNNCYSFLKKRCLQNVTVISLSDFEDDELLAVKNKRTKGEYCWTCTSSVILFVLNHYKEESCTYLDSDIYFFESPDILLNENNFSILITDHRYTKLYDQSKVSGKYCVQFISFKNDNNGLEALYWWREKCLQWCYNRVEDGKFGDQKYLDDWTERFNNVHILNHQGGGVAPWNVQQYKVYRNNKKTFVENKNSKNSSKLVFYHFHDLKFINQEQIDLGTYILKQDVIKNIYMPYVKVLYKIKGNLSEDIKVLPRKNSNNKFIERLSKIRNRSYNEILSGVKRSILKKKNVYSIEEITNS